MLGILMELLIISCLFVLYAYAVRKNLMPSLVRSCRIRYTSFATTVFLPVFLVLFSWIFVIRFLPVEKFAGLGAESILSLVLLAPVWEELVFRGIMLGAMVNLSKAMRIRDAGMLYSIVSLIMVSLVFSLIHQGELDLRMLWGLIFGIVYLADNLNPLPAIIAHMLSNLLAVIVQLSL